MMAAFILQIIFTAAVFFYIGYWVGHFAASRKIYQPLDNGNATEET